MFYKGKFIGGGDDVVSLHRSGKLTEMARDAGAAKISGGVVGSSGTPGSSGGAPLNLRYFVNGRKATYEEYQKHKL